MEKEKLDREVEQSFPASDPPAVSQPHEEVPETAPNPPAKRPTRSADWMYEKPG
jgi:hypothetical protein